MLRPVALATLPAASLGRTWLQRFASLLLEEMLQTGQLEPQLLHQNGRLSLKLLLLLRHHLKQLVLKPDQSMEFDSLIQNISLKPVECQRWGWEQSQEDQASLPWELDGQLHAVLKRPKIDRG